MTVADQQDLDVFEVKPQRFDILPDLRGAARQIAVD
jgi:hypothetical protein